MAFEALLKRLDNPPFGTDTTVSGAMTLAAMTIRQLEKGIAEARNSAIQEAVSAVQALIDNFEQDYRDDKCNYGPEFGYGLSVSLDAILPLTAYPAPQKDDPECTSCGGTGITYQTERPCACQPKPAATPAPVTVWYGSMPESNGRQNWTASLHRKGGDTHMDGFCFARSEYPDRVRYEADRMRWIIGELPERPRILDYNADLHSGYVAPAPMDHMMKGNENA